MLEWLSKNVGYVVTIVSGFSLLIGIMIKPIKNILKELKEQTERLKAIDADLADVLCSQLTREHDAMMQQGFCPSADKARISGIYARYKLRGRNHLADRFIDDVLDLPNNL